MACKLILLVGVSLAFCDQQINLECSTGPEVGALGFSNGDNAFTCGCNTPFIESCNSNLDLPCSSFISPTSCNNQLDCPCGDPVVGTVIRPQLVERVVNVPIIQDCIQTLASPVLENINYQATPRNCPCQPIPKLYTNAAVNIGQGCGALGFGLNPNSQDGDFPVCGGTCSLDGNCGCRQAIFGLGPKCFNFGFGNGNLGDLGNGGCPLGGKCSGNCPFCSAKKMVLGAV